MKICSMCNEEKEFLEFNKNSRKKDGYQGHCRICQKKYYKSYYDNNDKEKQRLYSKNTRHKVEIQNFVRSVKNNPCMDCGIKYPYYIMDFDHIDPSKKSFNVSEMITQRRSLVDIKKEIEKCEVVCANCHRERTHARSFE